MVNDIILIDLNGVNCYLVESVGGFILFDTGGHLVMDKQFTNRRELLLKKLEAAGCTKNNLNLIVLTHGDSDHACNAAYLRELYQTKIAMHSGDMELVEEPTLQRCMESFNYHSPELQQVFLENKEFITMITQKMLDDFERFSPDVILEDGLNLSQYGLDAMVIHIPGHTSGSIAILTKNRDLISGDIFVNMEKPDIAPNAEDFNQLDASINRLRSFSIETVYPGHGKPFKFNEI